MSSGRRGRGGEARGGRAARGGGSNPFRRGDTRGRPNGMDVSTRPASMQQDSLRGGAAPRGGPNARGGQDIRNNIRGRGLLKT
jgi:hypothetical protein